MKVICTNAGAQEEKARKQEGVFVSGVQGKEKKNRVRIIGARRRKKKKEKEYWKEGGRGPHHPRWEETPPSVKNVEMTYRKISAVPSKGEGGDP